MEGQTCAVVGAGPGIGLAVARRFAREGFRIALVARRAEALNGYVEALRASGITAAGYAADLAELDTLPAVFARLATELGAPDVLIYNAVAVTRGTPSELPPAQLLRDLTVSVVAAMSCAQQVLPAMRERGRGTILLTGGGFALNAYPPMTSLAVGKAALRNLAWNLAVELEPHGIRATTVTILGEVKDGTLFDPERVAESYWRLHAQTTRPWSRELVYNEAYASTL